MHPADLRKDAEAIASGFPELLAHARHLAATISLGHHGRRRSGPGDEFWQYRSAMPGDHLREIDWRRSARSDTHFVRQMEWQNVQSVHIWVDRAASMTYRTDQGFESKADRARVLGLATAILLSNAGESVGLMADPEPPKHGRGQITKMAVHLAEAMADTDYGKPPAKEMARGNLALFLSDFLGDWDELVEALSRAADQKVEGCLVQILDPSEEEFPFDGRTIFESMRGTLRFETRRAKAIRDDYLTKLAERKNALEALARRTGWLYTCHHTSAPAQPALMWIHNSLAGPER
ncbi:MAG: DUF58 domain-containing protein [Rhodobacteraceae bacterium]|nr:DUF58 domain-containing protein [Paracoccaceae bacterium]